MEQEEKKEEEEEGDPLMETSNQMVITLSMLSILSLEATPMPIPVPMLIPTIPSFPMLMKTLEILQLLPHQNVIHLAHRILPCQPQPQPQPRP